MVFQDPYSSLDPRMTIGELVGEGLRMLGGLSAQDKRRRVDEVLAEVGLARNTPVAIRTSCRAASASAWRSRGRWCGGRPS